MATTLSDLELKRKAADVDESSVDRSLVLSFQMGNPEAYDEIYARYRPLAERICRRILGDREDAQEAVQETMLRVLRGLPVFNGRYQLQAWIARIATNVSVDMVRARARRPAIDERPIDGDHSRDPDAGPELEYERLVERDLVISVLSDLPESHRTALVLRELEGRSHKEIGKALGITSAQAKALIHRAKFSFRRGWLRAVTDRGGVAGIALLPLVWALKAVEGVRRVADKVGGHAGQVAQAATPDVVSSAAASPAVTAAVGVGERVVAAGMAVLLAGGVTVGAVTVAKHAGSDKERAAAVSPAAAAADPVTTPPVVAEKPREHQARRDESKDHPKPDRPSQDGTTPIPEGTDTGEVPAPEPDPAPEEPPVPPVDPSLPPPLPPAPAWSYDFVTSTESVETCACDGSSTASSSRIERLEEGGFSFSQVVRGGVRDSGGDVTWPFSLQQWGRVGGESDGRIEYRFRLSSGAGTFLYYGSGVLAVVTDHEDGSATYRFEGTFDLLVPQSVAPGLPYRGFASVTIGVWQDQTIYTGSFTLQDA